MTTPKVTAIQNPEWLPAKLAKSVTQFNEQLNKLTEQEASLPARKRELGLKILQGEIDPAEAVKAKRALATAQEEIDMAYAQLHIRKLAFRADMESARAAEQKRAQAEAAQLKTKLETDVRGMGDPATRAQLVAADHALSAAVGKARGLTAAQYASPSVEENQWYSAWAVGIKRTFGIPL